MPQDFKELQLSIKQGAPASAVPRSWFIFINNVLRYLTIRNGKLITTGDKWTIECGVDNASTRWSGRVFFGGSLVYDLGNEPWTYTHVKVNLRTGDVSGENWNEESEDGLEEFEFYRVMTRVQREDQTYVLTWSSHTVGDIRCRIT